jgi:hypothetical protein
MVRGGVRRQLTLKVKDALSAGDPARDQVSRKPIEARLTDHVARCQSYFHGRSGIRCIR